MPPFRLLQLAITHLRRSHEIPVNVSVNDKYIPNRKISAKYAVGWEAGKVKRLRRLLQENLPFGRAFVRLFYYCAAERVFSFAKPCLPPSPTAKEAMLFLFCFFDGSSFCLFRGYVYGC